MTFTPEQNKLLSTPLNPKHIAKRPKGDIQLSYIEGYHVIDEANRIFGYDGWDHTITRLEKVHTSQYEKNGREHFVVTYLATVSVTVGGKISEDIGTGTSDTTSAGDSFEMASKTAVTDALKRALRVFGAQFGNSLYDKDIDHVAEADKFETRHFDLITEITKFTTVEEFDRFKIDRKDILDDLVESAKNKVRDAFAENLKRVK
jgi:DNA repair and recombination protein RAD52